MPAPEAPARRGRRRFAARLALALVACGATAAASGAALRAHEIRYHVSFKGIGAGEISLALTPGDGPGRWVYETRAYPSWLARFVVSGDSRERSWFRLTANGVEPERYRLDDGTRAHADDAEATYDRERGRVAGQVQGVAFDLPLEPGLQDVLSIRIAPVAELLAGREPRGFALLDGREVKHYAFSKVGTERLHTELGDLDTVVYTSERAAPAGGRSWRYWYAPALGWLPARAEQREDGKTRMVLAVRTLRWLQPAAAD